MPVQRTSSTRSAAVTGPARSVLRGELDKVGLPTLLTIMDMEKRTGVLILQRPRQLGRLHVRDGQIIRARVEGQRRMSGPEAVYQLVTWTEGQFELWLAEVEGRDEIRQPTSFLLMEGLRRQDEARGTSTATQVVPSDEMSAAFAEL